MSDREQLRRRERSDGEASAGGAGPSPDRLLLGMQRRLIQRKAEREARPTRIPEGGGQPLAKEQRERMEPAMGKDLSSVEVHVGGESETAAWSLGARAFTVGNHIHFGAGQFQPGTREGDRLLGHELTHVVQGGDRGLSAKADGPGPDGVDVSRPGDSAEVEADELGDHVASRLHGGKAGPAPLISDRSAAVSRKVHCDPDPNAKKDAQEGGEEEQEPESIPPQMIEGLLGGLKRLMGRGEKKPDDKDGKAQEGAARPAQEGGQQGAAQGGQPGAAQPAAAAGPVEMPNPEGLQSELSMDAFIGAAKQVETDWQKLGGADQRLEPLGKAINEQLKGVQVPGCDAEAKKMDPGQLGMFNEEPWMMTIDRTVLDQPSIDSARAAKLGNTVYHEARHGEQYHRMARMLAGKKLPVDQIQKMTSIRKDVVEHAATMPIEQESPEAAQAQSWFDSVNPAGKNFEQRKLVYENLTKTTKAFQSAQTKREQVWKDESSDQNARRAAADEERKAKREQLKAEQAYRELPEEADAFAAGDKLELLFLGGAAGADE
jgi:hypothetical protein